MELKVNGEKGEQTITLRPLFARETDPGFNKFVELQNAKEGEELKTFNDFMDYVENLAQKVSGLSAEDMGNLYSDDKNKILEYVANKIQGKADFLKPSQKQPDSAQKDTQPQSSS